MNKRFPGFPTEVSDKIELPSIEELLLMPMFNKISADDMWKYGTEFQRYLLNKVPLKNNTKYVSIYSVVQFLYPNVRAIMVKHNGKYENEWHWDDSDGTPPTWHILSNNCYARTEFNVNPLEINMPNIKNSPDFLIRQFREFINDNKDELGIKGKRMEPFKFHTFNNHLHRAVTSPKPEFRFFFRVMETDFIEPLSFPECCSSSFVYKKDGSGSIPSVTRTKNDLIINLSEMGW